MMVIGKPLRTVLVLIAIAMLAAGAAFLIHRKKRELAAAPRYGIRPVPVRVAVARRGTLVEKRDYLAVVEPIRRADVSARLTSTVEKVLHDEGDTVKAGEVLLTLDGSEIEEGIASIAARIEQAKADLAANEATVASLADSAAYWMREARRDKTLAEKGDIPSSMAEATADKASEFNGRLAAAKQKSTALAHLIESLERRKSQLETRLDYCTIRSPFHGVVARRFVDPGDLASPGKTLMVVEDRSRLKLAFDVPQQDLPRVHEGLPVVFDSGAGERRAAISHMYPSLNPARMLRAEVYLSSAAAEGLSCGAYVPLSVVLGRKENATLVPAASLVECPKHKTHVFVVKGDKLTHPVVKVVGRAGDDVAVEGIEPGDEVVTSTFLGWAVLSGGIKVEVVK